MLEVYRNDQPTGRLFTCEANAVYYISRQEDKDTASYTILPFSPW